MKTDQQPPASVTEASSVQTEKRECAATHGYEPWQPPFSYNRSGQWIEDIRGHRLLDMRGWGYLTGKGSEALGLEDDEAAKIQDSIGERVAVLMNAKVRYYESKSAA